MAELFVQRLRVQWSRRGKLLIPEQPLHALRQPDERIVFGFAVRPDAIRVFVRWHRFPDVGNPPSKAQMVERPHVGWVARELVRSHGVVFQPSKSGR